MPSGGNKTTLWFVFGVAVVGVAIFATYEISTDQWPALPQEKAVQPVVSYSKSQPNGTFAISLQPPIDHPQKGDPMDATLVLTNWGDNPVQIVPIDPGDKAFKASACPAIQLDSNQDPAPLVGPHSGKHYVVHLKVDCDQEAQPISLLYRAQILPVDANGKVDPKGKLIGELDGYIATAPLPLVTEGRRVWARSFALANGLLHLLLAPLVLAIVGVLLNEAAKKREEDRQNKQDERDKKLQQEQEARDRRNQVLNTLISGYRDLVTGDYLPISRRMQTVEFQLPKSLQLPAAGPLATSLTKAEIGSLLCAILLFRSRLLHFFTLKGGIYFRSSKAEFLFRDLMNGFFGKVRPTLGDDDFSRAVDLLHPEDTLVAAMEKYKSGVFLPQLTAQQVQQAVGVLSSGDAAAVAQVAAQYVQENQDQYKKNRELYERVEEKFLKWVNDAPAEFRSYTRLLQLATELLAFECDRPFYQTAPFDATGKDDPKLRSSGWYFDPPVIEFTAKMYEIPKDLKHDKPDDPVTGEKSQRGLYPQLDAYLKNLPPECRENIPSPLP